MVHANRKFEIRFLEVEESVINGKGEFNAYSLEELEEFWQRAKQKQRGEIE